MPKADGVDISHWNPIADWDAIPQFRLFSTKATEGKSFRSPTFDENWEQMRRRNFEFRGAYHWVRSDSPMSQQVANLKRALDDHGGLIDGEFVQIDWETTEGIPHVTLSQIEDFQARCEAEWPGRVITYASDWVPNFKTWRKRNSTYPLWYANYNLGSTSTGGRAECARYSADVWQWTSKARVAGFADPTIDMNEVLDWTTLVRIANTETTTPPEEDDDMPLIAKIYKPPADMPDNPPWLIAIDGAVRYASSADAKAISDHEDLNSEQYPLMLRSAGLGDPVVIEMPDVVSPVLGGVIEGTFSATLSDD